MEVEKSSKQIFTILFIQHCVWKWCVPEHGKIKGKTETKITAVVPSCMTW